MGGCATKPKDPNFVSENPTVQKSPEHSVNAVEDDPAAEKVSDEVVDGNENISDDKENTKESSSSVLEPQKEIENSVVETNADAGQGVAEKDEPDLIDLQEPVNDPNIVDGDTETNNQSKDKNEASVDLINNFETENPENSKEEEQQVNPKIPENYVPASVNPSDSETVVKDLPATGNTEESVKDLLSAGNVKPTSVISA